MNEGRPKHIVLRGAEKKAYLENLGSALFRMEKFLLDYVELRDYSGYDYTYPGISKCAPSFRQLLSVIYKSTETVVPELPVEVSSGFPLERVIAELHARKEHPSYKNMSDEEKERALNRAREYLLRGEPAHNEAKIFQNAEFEHSLTKFGDNLGYDGSLELVKLNGGSYSFRAFTGVMTHYSPNFNAPTIYFIDFEGTAVTRVHSFFKDTQFKKPIVFFCRNVKYDTPPYNAFIHPDFKHSLASKANLDIASMWNAIQLEHPGIVTKITRLTPQYLFLDDQEFKRQLEKNIIKDKKNFEFPDIKQIREQFGDETGFILLEKVTLSQYKDKHSEAQYKLHNSLNYLFFSGNPVLDKYLQTFNRRYRSTEDIALPLIITRKSFFSNLQIWADDKRIKDISALLTEGGQD